MKKYKILLPGFWMTVGALGIAAVAAVFQFSFQNFFFVTATSGIMYLLGAYIEKQDGRKKPNSEIVKYKLFLQSFAAGIICAAIGCFPKTFIGICVLLYAGGIFDTYAKKQRDKYREHFVLIGFVFGAALIMFWLATYKNWTDLKLRNENCGVFLFL